MRTVLTLMVISTLTLSACSGWRDSRVNPTNWFGNSRSAPVATAENPNPLIPQRTSMLRRDKREKYEGTLVAEVTDLVIERTSTGGIVRVTGQTIRQGAYDVRLISENEGKPVGGVLTFSLKALQPTDQGQGTTAGRTVRVGEYVSKEVLAQTTTVQVIAARNTRTTRR